MFRKQGFTLIELLIVVAIIAILAAIAVPNFLEAQTRSKVARVKADHRTLAGAIEMYMIDYNVYLRDGDDYPGFFPALWAQTRVFRKLTTPVAYISSALYDPFHQANHGGNPPPAMSLLFPGPPPYTYAYITQGNFGTHKGKPKTYGILSVGPSSNFDSAEARDIGEINTIYDATNGTISFGDVIRYGPGGPEKNYK